MPPETRKAPKKAFRFRAGPVEFAAAGEGTDEKTFPFSILARSSDPIDHWYWGRVVHDMAGFTPSKATIPVDYCHCPDEVLGYGNKFDASNAGLKVTGALVQFQADDRVAEVTYKRAAGVPY